MVIDPREQGKDVQKVVGPFGESMVFSDGLVSVTEQSEDVRCHLHKEHYEKGRA
jgi:hypothetical protein